MGAGKTRVLRTSDLHFVHGFVKIFFEDGLAVLFGLANVISMFDVAALKHLLLEDLTEGRFLRSAQSMISRCD